jgi:hypothetical protein
MVLVTPVFGVAGAGAAVNAPVKAAMNAMTATARMRVR